MATAVSDSSTLIHLSLLGRLSLLRAFYDEVFVPSAVWREVVEEGRGRPGANDVRAGVTEGWLRVLNIQEDILVRSLKRELDEGESEAIVLALKHGCDQVLIDESHARRIAASLGLERTGVIGILIRAKKQGILDSLRAELDKLRGEGTFWLSDTVYASALEAVGE